MNTVEPLILEVNGGGLPVRWINCRHAAELIYGEKVLWSVGETITLRGGVNADTGTQSTLDINSIIAVNDGANRFAKGLTPILTNKELFRRDKNICLYCGNHFPNSQLTRDHVVPVSKGGPDIWENVVTCCAPCNLRKDDKTLKEAGLELLAVPYVPNIAEWLILSNRRILADQMEFLMNMVPEKNRSRYN